LCPPFAHCNEKEDPYKLVILAKDLNRVCVTSAEFFFAEGEMSIVTSDEEGVIRMYEYNPNGEQSQSTTLRLIETGMKIPSPRMGDSFSFELNSMARLSTAHQHWLRDGPRKKSSHKPSSYVV
jgi:hypothetical protein